MAGSPELNQEGAIQAFYGSCVAEQWSRFDRYARVEEYVLNKVLRENLPDAPARILDIGGGNGRHALHLAANGYKVSLCDITAELLADACQRSDSSEFPLAEITRCDARRLDWPTGYADGALMLGPMYCILDPIGRAAALQEAQRVLTPGAPLFVQFLSRIAALRSILEVAAVTADSFDWQAFIRDGVFREPQLPDFFRIHYFSTPEEALWEIREAGFRDAAIRGMDGPASIFGQRVLADAPDRIVEQWGEIAWTIGADPGYRYTSTHFLAVTYK